jgi:hypothetical protein
VASIFHTRGPVERAVAALVDTPPEPQDAAVFLADLVDLPGAVGLAEALAADAQPAEPADPDALRAAFHAGWAEARARLDDALTHAYKARYRLTTPETGLRLIAQAQLGRRPTAAALRATSRALWAPYGAFLETHTKRARFAVRDLREALGPQIAGQSPAAARLAQLDAALGAAVHAQVEALVRRVGHAAEARFVAQVTARLKAVKGAPTEADLEPLLGVEGTARALFEQALAVAQAIIAHDRQRLEALVEAAIRTRAGGDPRGH